MRGLTTSILQYVWPIIDPDTEAPLTRAEVLAHAYPALEDVTEEHACTITGPPLWTIQPAAVTPGWDTWPGRLLIALIPVEHHPIATDTGELLFTRAQWEEIHAAEQVQLAAAQVTAAAEQRIAREQFDADVVRLHAAGLSNSEITRVLLSPDAQHNEPVRRSLIRSGLKGNTVRRDKRRHKYGTCPAPDDALVTEWHRAGLTATEIARAAGFSTPTITATLHRLELTTPADTRELTGAAA